ncbi:hypothetical protein [Roseibacillus persicicus]|uniref:hypothetical protein n=1 Tax=Roseibacillus persicicus TaxID=454148 RepID=UPI00280EC680|nr:hypothetical protein [Roseibacillus persicicus]MDQ8189978.1 hypothetical protein [Roseibacillus persicicus]
MRGYTGNNSTQPKGYLLLEVILAMGLAAALLSGIFAIATGSMSLAEKVVEEGRYQTRREAFLNFLGRNFEQLPGNAVVELVTQDTSQRFLPTLTIQNAPVSFAFAGQPISAQAIVLTTVPVPSGGVNVVLEYYEEPLLDDEDSLAEDRQEPAGSIILYRDIWRFELRVLDSRTMEWISDWDIQGRLPLQIELNAVFEPNGEEVIHYFWIPPKTNPAALMRSINQQQQGTGTTTTPTPTPGQGGATPSIPGGGTR